MKTVVTHLLAASILALAVTGCGKSAPVETIAPIDSVFTKKPSNAAKSELGVAQQDREDGEVDSPETSRVGGPTNEKKGFQTN